LFAAAFNALLQQNLPIGDITLMHPHRLGNKDHQLLDKRKPDPKRRAAVITIFCPYQSLVRLDNGARDGQTHTHASRLVGVKRFKDRF
jgi:hypothetical protein